jgi:hypothetical protein
MVELEKAGIPTVTILSDGFQHDSDASARAFGMGPLPRVVVPKVYNNITTEEAQAQTGPVVPDIIKLLTTQVSGEALEESAVQAAQARRETFSDTDQMGAFEAFNSAYLERDWGDGFPLIPPTRERVEAMLRGTTLPPDEVVCTLPPGNGIVTVQKIAVNSVMAGAKPGHLPVIIAACRAIAAMRPFDVRGLLMSTSAGAPMVMVNGPIRHELGINSKRASLGPGRMSQANVVIGRAFTLTLKNCGHWYPGVLDMDTIGTPRKFSLCVGENEEDSPWEPWHVERGFKEEQNVVTIFPTSGEHDHGNQGVDTAEGLLRSIAYSCPGSGGYIANLHGELDDSPGGATLILIAPPHARPIAKAGFSKRAAKEFLHNHVRFPARHLVAHFNVKDKVRYEWRWVYDLPPYEQERVMLYGQHDPSRYHLVCVGASDRAKNLILSSGTPSMAEITHRTQ